MSTDNLYAGGPAEPGSFKFDESVADVFPDMLRRSIPGYAASIQAIGTLAASYSWAIDGNQEDIYQLRYEPRERFSVVGRRNEEDELTGDILYGRKFYVGVPVPALTGGAKEERRIGRVSIELPLRRRKVSGEEDRISRAPVCR